MNSYAIYIVQDDTISGVHSGIFQPDREALAEDIVWPGTDHADAVQRLQDKYRLYEGDDFLVGRVDSSGRPNHLYRVRVSASGVASSRKRGI